MSIRGLIFIFGLMFSSISVGQILSQTLSELPVPLVASDFSLEVYEGEGRRYSLTDLKGKPTIVNFWATWCPPCREELPSMNRAWQKIKAEGIAMVAINVGEDQDTLFLFLSDYPIDFPILLDRSGKTIEEWPVQGLPTTFVLDPQGRIVYRAIGGRAWDDEKLLDRVRALRSNQK